MRPGTALKSEMKKAKESVEGSMRRVLRSAERMTGKGRGLRRSFRAGTGPRAAMRKYCKPPMGRNRAPVHERPKEKTMRSGSWRPASLR